MMFPEAEAEGFIGPLETERGKKSRVKRWFVQPSAGYRPLILKKKKKLLTIARERTYREEARSRATGFQHVSKQRGLSFSETPKPCFLVDGWFIVRSDFPSSWKIANFLRVILWDYKKKACMIKYLLFRIFLADASLINLSCLVRYLKIEGWKIFDCALLWHTAPFCNN